MTESGMNVAVFVTVAIFMAGVIYRLGQASQRLEDHERRVTKLENVSVNINHNLGQILDILRGGGTS